MKVWLDDDMVSKERRTPKGWVRALTYDDAIRFLSTGEVTEISLDYDIADFTHGREMTGADVARWIERKVHMEGFIPPIMNVHSANSVGRKNMDATIDSIKRVIRER